MKLKQIISVVKVDLKMIFRDKSLLFILIIPVAIILICRFGFAKISEFVPALPDYYWIIVAALTAIVASTPAYLMGFILLDERDENVDILLRIIPFPPNFVLKCRIGFMIVLGFLFSMLILLLNGLVVIPFFKTIPVSILFSMIPPILTLAIVLFSKNKIEAVTMYKGLNTFLVLPIAAFFIPAVWKYFFGILPFFWTFDVFESINSRNAFMFSFFIGILVHLVFILILYHFYKKKVV
ncbi:MAG: hypothetical protein JXR31_16550 [Prolixibacteraceae bacterium]|nr:hypothetical protein [Prolixibacteraceae bacterium]MBN2775868.1 hypothetical protein [Prolixibacteraceae bacterium]